MPVSYSWLFAEKEPHVIGVEMIRECIEVRFSLSVWRRTVLAELSGTRASAPGGIRILVPLQLPKGDPEQVAEKKKIMKFLDVDVLAFSYKDLVKIENLTGFDSLTKLKLDCNRIAEIEGLGHLVCSASLFICSNGPFWSLCKPTDGTDVPLHLFYPAGLCLSPEPTECAK